MCVCMLMCVGKAICQACSRLGSFYQWELPRLRLVVLVTSHDNYSGSVCSHFLPICMCESGVEIERERERGGD